MSNLDAALLKIQEMIKLLAQANTQAKTPLPNSGSLGSGIPVGDYIAPVSRELGQAASTDALMEYSEAAQGRADAFAHLLDLQNAADQLALDEYIAKLSLASSASTSSVATPFPSYNTAAMQSGNRYTAQAAAQYNITINAGVGSDPNAIAEAIDNVLREARDRGTLTAA